MRTVRPRARSHPVTRRRWGVAVLAFALGQPLAGCATIRATVSGWSEDELGLSHAQRTLRTALASGDFPAALEIQDDDELLRALATGATAYYSAQYARSAALLDTAALLADARITTSLSRASLALVTNDLARAYEPRRTELLFIPYYAMLSFVQLGQWDDAAVEARRLSALLARYGTDRDGGERDLHAAMHYLAGAVFERAGEGQASAVAYRNARALSPALGSVAHSASRDTGDVVVIVERGFVAHRVTEILHLDLPSTASANEADTTNHAVLGVADRVRRAAAAATATPAVRAGGAAFGQREVVAAPAGEVTEHRRHERAHDETRHADDDERRVHVAVAALRHSPATPGMVKVRAPEAGEAASVALVMASADVDDASAVDERRERGAVIARELARATARVALTKAVQDRTGDAGGRLAQLGATFLARADVRSWHVLPRELVIVRLRLPAGRQMFVVGSGGDTGAPPVSARASISAGAVTLLPIRLWTEPVIDARRRCGSRQRSCE